MNLKETMQADLGAIATDLGDQVFTWNGEDYICIPSSTNVEGELGIGGFNINNSRTITVNKDLFTDDLYPKEKDIITFNDTRYRIEKRINNANDAFLHLILIDTDLEM